MTQYIIQTIAECEEYTDWIAKFKADNHVAPTIREAAKAWDMSPTWAGKIFRELEDRGFIKRPRINNRAMQRTIIIC